jgi:hypothetical protein
MGFNAMDTVQVWRRNLNSASLPLSALCVHILQIVICSFARQIASRDKANVHAHIAASTQLVVFCLVWAQHLTEFPGGSGKAGPKRVASNEAYLLLEKATQLTHHASNVPLWDKVPFVLVFCARARMFSSNLLINLRRLGGPIELSNHSCSGF